MILGVTHYSCIPLLADSRMQLLNCVGLQFGVGSDDIAMAVRAGSVADTQAHEALTAAVLRRIEDSTKRLLFF